MNISLASSSLGIEQLTDSGAAKGSLVVSEDKAAWVEFDGQDYEVFFFNGAGVVQLTDNTVDDGYFQNYDIILNPPSKNLAISGDWVAWSSESEIYLFDGATTRQLSDNESYNAYPHVSGNQVVWGGDEVYLYDGVEVRLIAPKQEGEFGFSVLYDAPQIFDGQARWLAFPYFSSMAFPPFTVQKFDGTDILDISPPYRSSYPSLSGRNFIGFVHPNPDFSNSPYQQESVVYFYDGSQTKFIATLPGAYGGWFLAPEPPVISGNTAAWVHSGKIYYYDGAETRSLTPESSNNSAPHIDGGKVVWVNSDDGDAEIFFYDGAAITQLTYNETADHSPRISGDYVFWLGASENGDQLYRLALSEINIPVVTVAVSQTEILENGAEETVITLTRSGSTENALTINYDLTGSADSQDYLGAPQGLNQSLTFEAGADTVTLSFAAIDDAVIELDKTLSFNLKPSETYSVGSGNPVTLTLVNDDHFQFQSLDGLYKVWGYGYWGTFGFEVSPESVVWTDWRSEGTWNETEPNLFILDQGEKLQLTHNTHQISAPKVLGNQVVWQGDDGQDSEIFLYDGADVVQLTDNAFEDINPEVSEDLVVWLRQTEDGWGLYRYDGASISLLLNSRVESFKVFGSSIVWQRGRNANSEIYFHNGAETLRLTQNNREDSNPQIAGSRVVWSGHDGNDFEIYLYEQGVITQLTDNDIDDVNPLVSEQAVVWSAEESDASRLYYYDDNNATLLFSSSINNWDSNLEYDLDGRNVVWSETSGGVMSPFYSNLAGRNRFLYLYDGQDIHTLQKGDSNFFFPQIAGDQIIWYVPYATGHQGNMTGVALYYGNISALNPPEPDAAIWGTAGPDDLKGTSGPDTFKGLAGDDRYWVNHGEDWLEELPDGGWDTVYAKTSYTLPDRVEKLQLTGAEDLSAWGNDGDNVLVGNRGDNLLSGGAGDDLLVSKSGLDTLMGGLGNDVYLVAQAGAQVIENLDEGVDKIYASVSFVLLENVENLKLVGDAPLTAIGNNLANKLVGNEGDNRVQGGVGNDILRGQAGQDTLIGGAGEDQLFLGRQDGQIDKVFYTLGDGMDTVFEFAKGVDQLAFVGVETVDVTVDRRSTQLRLGVQEGGAFGTGEVLMTLWNIRDLDETHLGFGGGSLAPENQAAFRFGLE